MGYSSRGGDFCRGPGKGVRAGMCAQGGGGGIVCVGVRGWGGGTYRGIDQC
jgi:hypothetical protein